MRIFSPKTVDAIVASFQQTIDDLTRVSVEQTELMNKKDEEIKRASEAKWAASKEAERALRIAAKLEEVLA